MCLRFYLQLCNSTIQSNALFFLTGTVNSFSIASMNSFESMNYHFDLDRIFFNMFFKKMARKEKGISDNTEQIP